MPLVLVQPNADDFPFCLFLDLGFEIQKLRIRYSLFEVKAGFTEWGKGLLTLLPRFLGIEFFGGMD